MMLRTLERPCYLYISLAIGVVGRRDGWGSLLSCLKKEVKGFTEKPDGMAAEQKTDKGSERRIN